MFLKEGVKKIYASKSKLFALFCFCFLIGVVLASLADIKLSRFLVYIIFGIPFIGGILSWLFTVKISRKILLYGVGVWIILFGFARYAILFPPPASEYIHFYAPAKVELIGHIATEPDDRIDGVRYIVEAKTLVRQNSNTFVRGRVSIKYERYPRYTYGEQVRVHCTLKIPEPIISAESGKVFHYDKYLALSRVFAICERAQIESIGKVVGDPVYSWLLTIKHKVAEHITRLWPEPLASFMAGLLYGYRGGLGALNDLFSRTGVTHIVAVSGFNITVIATILINVFLYWCVPRQKAFWAVSGGIVLFVLFTGASASVVRAGVMGIITLFAQYIGRSSRIGNVLLLTAVIMTLHNPLILLFDAGFQLSFLSTLGLVYLSPLLKKYERFFPQFLGIRENIISTIVSIIATVPLILWQFGRLSIVAPVVNLLILWVIPWLMLCGAVATAVSFFYFPFGQLLAWFGWIGMSYIILIVEWFARLRFAALEVSIPIFIMVAMYTIMVYFVCTNSLCLKK